MKCFVEGSWREVLPDGSLGGRCSPPTEEERKQMEEDAKRQTHAEQKVEAAQPKVLRRPLAFGEKCPFCGTAQKLLHPEANKCPTCHAKFDPAPPSPPKPGTKQYKVITQRDEYFASKFNPEALQVLLNDHAADGWRVVSMTATDVGSFWGSFWAKGGGSSRQELVVLLERTVE